MGESKRKQEQQIRLERPAMDFCNPEVLRDRGLEMFLSALADGEITQPECIAMFLCKEGLLTRSFIFSLLDSGAYESPVTTLLEELLHSTTDDLSTVIGGVWIPLPVQEADGVCSAVICRRIFCKVSKEGEFVSVASTEIDRWEHSLAQVAASIEPTVIEFASQAQRGWTKQCVRFSLEHPSAQRSRTAIDRSFELAAAVAMISATFHRSLPSGTVALGQISSDGEVEPLANTDLLRLKCRGMVNSLSMLSVVFVAHRQYAQVVEMITPMLPPHLKGKGRVTFTPINNVHEIFEKIQVNKRAFTGKTKPSRFDGTRKNIRYVMTLGLGDSGSFLKMHAMNLDEGRYLLSGGLAEFVALAWYCGAFIIGHGERVALTTLGCSGWSSFVGHCIFGLFMCLFLVSLIRQLLRTAPAHRMLAQLAERETAKMTAVSPERFDGFSGVLELSTTWINMLAVIREQFLFLISITASWYVISIPYHFSSRTKPWSFAYYSFVILCWVLVAQIERMVRHGYSVRTISMDKELIGELSGGFLRVGVMFGLMLHLHFLPGAHIVLMGTTIAAMLATHFLAHRRTKQYLAESVYWLSFWRRWLWVIGVSVVMIDYLLRFIIAFPLMDHSPIANEQYHSAFQVVGAIAAFVASWQLVGRSNLDRTAKNTAAYEYFNFGRYWNWLLPLLVIPPLLVGVSPAWVRSAISVTEFVISAIQRIDHRIQSFAVARWITLEGLLAWMALVFLAAPITRLFRIYADRYARIPTYLDRVSSAAAQK